MRTTLSHPTLPPVGRNCGNTFQADPADAFGGWCGQGECPPTTPLQTYVAARVEEDGGCLRWTGTVCNGHPAGALFGKRCVLIRRALWEAANGPIPAGKIIRCTCETPLCVELDHCELTTYQRLGKQLGAMGMMSGPVRSGKIAAAKRVGKQAKITQDQAREIRLSDETGKAAAKRYGISEATVSKIRLGLIRREFTGNVFAGLGA
jgi:hypothetical protein